MREPTMPERRVVRNPHLEPNDIRVRQYATQRRDDEDGGRNFGAFKRRLQRQRNKRVCKSRGHYLLIIVVDRTA